MEIGEAIKSPLELIIKIVEYVSLFAFAIGTILFANVAKKFGKSSLGVIFAHISLGALVFVFISLFVQLGPSFFGVSVEVYAIMWHAMFYVSAFLFYVAFKSLTSLGEVDAATGKIVNDRESKMWTLLAIIVILVIFFLPKVVESLLAGYASTQLSEFGFHYLFSSAIIGYVMFYLIIVKKKLGQIGQSIASPMIVAIGSLVALQLWQLFVKSWNLGSFSEIAIVGFEHTLLLLAGISIAYAAVKLHLFLKRV